MGFEIKEASSGGEFFYRVKAANGETLVHSQTYTREVDAERGTKALLRAVGAYLSDGGVLNGARSLAHGRGISPEQFENLDAVTKERFFKEFRMAIYAALPHLKAETPFNDLGMVVCGREWDDGWGEHICWKAPHAEGQHRCKCDASD